MSTKNCYKNKLFSVLGDSISTFEGYSEPYDAVFYDGWHKCQADILKINDTWWGQVIESLDGTLLVNNSFSGSMVCKHRSCVIPSYGCSDERTSSLDKKSISPDVIMVFLGTNDWGHGVKLKPDNEAEENDLTIFSVAYKSMLEKLRKNYPSAELWCFTLAKSGYKNGKEIKFPYLYGGRHIEEYCEVIRDCAEKYGCRLIDLYKSAEPYDTIDGFHPNASGMKTIADAVLISYKK